MPQPRQWQEGECWNNTATTEEFKDIFNSIGCFNGMFSLQLKPGSKPYQVPPRCVAYTLQKPFEEELELDITPALGIDERAEWCNSFVLVPKANGKVRLCLDPARLNQALIRPMLRGSTLNDILPKLNNAQYLSLLDVSSVVITQSWMKNHHTWQHMHTIKVQKTTIWCIPCRRYVSEKNRQNI